MGSELDWKDSTIRMMPASGEDVEDGAILNML